MAEKEQVGSAALQEAAKLLLPLGAVVVGAVFLVAGAANLGFYDAFGIQDLRVVGIDKSAIVDHAILPSVILTPMVGGLVGYALWAARVSTKEVPPPPELPSPSRKRRHLVFGVAVVVCGLAAMAWQIKARPGIGVAGFILAGFALAVVKNAPRTVRWTVTHPWQFIGACVAVTALVAFMAFLQGAAWGKAVAERRRADPPALAYVVLVQWPRGAVLDERADLCTSDILLGRAGGTYVLFNVRTRLVHEVPANQPLTRISLRAVMPTGCPS
ncbi:MAG TPA: hypothetical protein VM938_00245 [Acidimicrobiales bacterium]|nr:hypothetical protein [Acidimicrobiales bacterium]